MLHFLDLQLEVLVFVPYGSRFANETVLRVISQLMQIKCQEGFEKRRWYHLSCKGIAQIDRPTQPPLFLPANYELSSPSIRSHLLY